MDDYQVRLDIYNGPLDLLLYLIKKEEIDIYDIPIAKIADQYIEYVRILQQLDPNLAGEFLVMAATLMEIKSRMLLPRHDDDQGQEEVSIDPRSELVSKLLEYKQFKDAAHRLSERAERQSERFPRVPILQQVGADQIDLEDLQLWDLVDAFARLMEATLGRVEYYRVESDDTPIAIWQDYIIDRLSDSGPIAFSVLFEDRNSKAELIGVFLALLELIRQGIVGVEQDRPFGQIYLFLKVDLTGREEDIESSEDN